MRISCEVSVRLIVYSMFFNNFQEFNNFTLAESGGSSSGDEEGAASSSEQSSAKPTSSQEGMAAEGPAPDPSKSL